MQKCRPWGSRFLLFQNVGKGETPPIPPRKRWTGGRGEYFTFSWRRVWAWTGEKTCQNSPRHREDRATLESDLSARLTLGSSAPERMALVGEAFRGLPFPPSPPPASKQQSGKLPFPANFFPLPLPASALLPSPP